MARRAARDSLSIPELERILQSRRDEMDELLAHRRDLEKQIQNIDRRIRQLGGRAGRRGRGGRGRIGRPPGPGRVRRGRGGMSLAQAIEHVLSGAGGPMKVTDIVESVRNAGYRSSSANFRGIVNQTLIKDDRFVSAGRGLYRLKKT